LRKIRRTSLYFFGTSLDASQRSGSTRKRRLRLAVVSELVGAYDRSALLLGTVTG
jgi:hypothetical protein